MIKTQNSKLKSQKCGKNLIKNQKSKLLKLCAFVPLCLCAFLLARFAYPIDLVNIPNAETLKKGDLSLSFRIYDNGGLVMNSGLGLSNNVFVGVPLDMQNAIGDEKIETSLPLLLFLKVKCTSGNEKIPSISLGYYDPYGYKKRWEGKRIKGLKGLYLVATKPIILFDLKHNLSFGFLVDVEDYEKGGFSLFSGTELALGGKFILLAEVESIPIDSGSENKKAGFNLGTKFLLAENLDLSICAIDLFGGNPSRIVKIGYKIKVF
ncbi:MAG: hypothetical protein AB1630_01955 [bacterium]